MKKKVLVLSLLLSLNVFAQEVEKQNNSKVITDIDYAMREGAASANIYENNWFLLERMVRTACEKSGFEIKHTIQASGEIVCLREEEKGKGKNKKLLERNVKFTFKEVMVGYHVETLQWFEEETLSGDLKTYVINQKNNRNVAIDILNKFATNIK